MAATRDDISRWFDDGVAEGATHMIIVTDTFDWEDFPVYVLPGQSARVQADDHRSRSMQKVMEVYSLKMDKGAQLAEFRAFHYD